MNSFFKTFVVALVLAASSMTAFASPTAGPMSRNTSVIARGTDVYYVNLRGGETTTISLAGDGDTDLDLYVFDGNGNLVVRCIGNSDREEAFVIPGSTGTFRVEVRNLGNVYNNYSIRIR